MDGASLESRPTSGDAPGERYILVISVPLWSGLCPGGYGCRVDRRGRAPSVAGRGRVCARVGSRGVWLLQQCTDYSDMQTLTAPSPCMQFDSH